MFDGGGVEFTAWLGDGTCNLRGSPVITDNTKDGEVDNLSVFNDRPVQVTGALTSGASVGINVITRDYDNGKIYPKSTGTFTSGYKTYNSGTDPQTYFTSDNPAYSALLTSGGEAQIAPIQPDASYSSTASFQYNGSEKTAVTNLSNCSVSGTNKATNAGNYTATVTPTYGHAWSDYSTAAKTVNWTIAKADLSPTVSMSGWTYGGTASNPSVSGNTGGGTVSYAYKTQGAADSTYTAAKPSNAGAYTVRATIAQAANYNGATTATKDFTINRANISPSVSMSGWTYGGAASDPSVSGNSGNGTVTYAYKVKDAADGTYTTTKPTNAGSYTVRATIAQTANYNGGTATKDFTISRANITPGVSMSGWTYGETAPEPVVTGNTESGEVTYLYAGTSCGGAAYSASVPPTNAGEYTVTATIAQTANYNGATTATADFTINRANISPSVSMSGWTYGGAASDPSVSGNSGNGTVTYAYKVKDAADGTYTTTKPTNAGSYTVRATIAQTANYNGGTATKDFTISRANITPGVSMSGWTYGETAPEPVVTGNTESGEVTYLYAGTSCGGAAYSASVPPTNAGEYTVTATIAQTANYNGATTATADFTVAKKPATVTVNGGQSKTYGEDDPALTATVTGTVGSDTLNYTLSRAEGENAGEYAVTVTPGENPNYDVTATNGTFTIAKKSATVTADAKSKTYGDADPALTATVEGTVGGDTLNYTLARATGENVGDYGIAVTLGSNPNYSVTPTDGTFTINQKTATVTADAKSKTYGDADPALTATVEGTVGEETLNYSLSRAAGEIVGGSPYVITVTLGSNPNYDVTPTNGAFTINRADITPSVALGGWTFGDAANTPVVTGNTENGDVTYLYTGTSYGGVAYSADVPPTDAGEYTVTATVAQTANYNGAVTEADFTVAKATAYPPSAAQKPTAVTGLSETGGQHKLIQAPEAVPSGYTMEYHLGDGAWNTAIPTAKEKGTYTVSVRYVPDDNHLPFEGDDITVTIDRQQDTITMQDNGVTLTIDNRTGTTMKKILDDAKAEGEETVTKDGGNTTRTTKEVNVELLVVDKTTGDVAAATGTSDSTAYKTSNIKEVYDVNLQKITTTTTITTKDSDGSLVNKNIVTSDPVPIPYSGGAIMVTLPYVKSSASAVCSVIYYDGAGNYTDINATYDETARAFTFYTSHTSIYFVYEETVDDADDVSAAFDVTLRPSGTGGRTYDVVLSATDGKIINRFTAADLTFSLTGTTGHIVYDVAPNAAAYIKLNDALSGDGRYEFYVDGVDYSGVSGSSITLGTVTFGGYGNNWKFQIDSAVVNTTKFNDNVVVTTEGTASATVGSMVYTDKDTNTNPYTAKIDPLTLNPDTKNLTVNVTFPNGIQDNASAYQDMTLTVSGGDLSQDIVVKLGQTASIADITPNAYPYGKDAKTTATALQTGDYNYGAATLTADRYTVTLTQILTLNTMYTVTVSGAGYRTARYNVLMDDNKTLTFWNNVMDAATVVETEKDSSAVQVTYLAGDIVEDAQINVYDLSAVVSYFGDEHSVTAESPYAKYDLNRDGKIDSIDVAYVLVSWGK